MRRGAPILFLSLLCTFGATEIRYKVTVQPETSNSHVQVSIPKTQGGTTFRMPNWAPGSYRLADNHRLVKNLKATDGQGKELKIGQSTEKLTKAYGDGADRKTVENEVVTWQVEPAASTVIEYDLATVVNDGAVHWSGPSSYIYLVDRLKESCRLEVETPKDWQVYTGLDETKSGSKTFTAPDYDVLADNPVSTGDLKIIRYTERGKQHEIVMRGKAREEMDLEELERACRHVTRAQTDFLGSMPYNKYVWHFNVTDNLDGAGGLEHLSSTQITLASGLGPRAVSVLSHEFFHLWNVKRIRTKVLGPFDYTRLPETGALWWLEGVTDYYAHYLLHAYGWTNQDEFFGDIIDNLGTVRRNPARLEVSPYMSSFRVGEASNGRGNSGGYRVNYYSMGWLCGMILDLELRGRTAGKHSLDEVTRALWEMCKDDKPGFEEDEIRRQLIKFGGYDMAGVYDNLIMKPGETPVESALARAGLKIEEVDVTNVNFGAALMPDVTRGTVVSRSTGALQNGDVIKKIGNNLVEGSRMRQQAALQKSIKSFKPGDKVGIQVQRGDQLIDVEVTVVGTMTKQQVVKVDPNATPEQKRIAQGWLMRRPIR